jgi:hypothetical protein
MERLTHQQRTATHRDELRQRISKARSRQGLVTFGGYIGGYCANSDCDVRQVLIRVKGYYDSVKEIRCPSCRSLLMLGDHEWSIEVATTQEFSNILKKRAIDNVWWMLKDEQRCRDGDLVVWRGGADLCRVYTLDDLAQAFREREAQAEGK